MKFIIMKMMMVISFMIPFISNPISMGMILILQTMFATILMNKMIMSSWFSFITFLMMIGGLLIIFTYMSSIASNEKFKFNLNLSIFMLIIILITDEMIIKEQMKENQQMIFIKTLEQVSMMKLYNKKSLFMSILLMIYLLFTMIVVSKMVKHYYGPLRKKNYE
uniref:NADH dehydrogenase subunit 6 n=1 Tax=Mileewa lamellata TaxID=2984022 RepID=A0A977TM40_9HEMI|nr:NADH dehydrogenase subunit 6 [Mileewa lamellata]UXX17550.1 NADH dehydrogenase subunit 6 [Mileewa lamellata]